MFGGIIRVEGPDIILDTVEKYDPKKDKWEIVSTMPIGRSHGSADSCGGFLYLAGGQTINADESPYPIMLDVVHRWEPETDTWEEMPPLGMKRSHHVLVAARLETRAQEDAVWAATGSN